MTTENLELTIRLSNGTRLPLDVGAVSPADCTVLQIKEKLVNECPVERQRLIYKGRILEDDRTLHDYGIVPKSTLFLVKGSAPATSAQPPAPAAAASSTTRSPTTTMSTPSSTNPPSASAFAQAFPSAPPSASASASNPWGAAPANPWGGMIGGGAGNHMMPPNPEQMQQMMNSPLMSSLLDNPQMLQNIMEMQMQSNPQMRQMMESNPMLREMLGDPSVLRQAVEMMRNPAALQQAMRNQDLAMSNIENMPGGFAALSNMYRDIQQPLEESMMGAGANTSSSRSGATPNTTHSNAGATGSAMPNPWGSPATTTTNVASTNRTNNNNNNAAPPMNPFAAMMGGGDAANNPFAAMMGGAGAANNPFAAMMGAPPPANPWAAAAGGGMPPQPSPEQLNAAINMMDNPMMQQMMDQALQQNPEFFRNVLTSQNPMFAQMFQNNPEAADNMIRTMMNPQVMRSMMQMQQAMSGMSNPNSNASATASLNTNHMGNPLMPGGMDFSSLFQSMQNTHIGGQPQNPADRYRNQLRSLYDMGFDDEQQSLAALQAAHGNLNRAVDMLLAGEVPASSPPVAAPAPPSSEGNNEESQSPAPAPKDAEDKKND